MVDDGCNGGWRLYLQCGVWCGICQPFGQIRRHPFDDMVHGMVDDNDDKGGEQVQSDVCSDVGLEKGIEELIRVRSV